MARAGKAIGLALAVATLACGTDAPAGAPDAEAFRATAERIDAAAAAYGAAAAAAPGREACLATHAAYDRDVRPMVEWMREMAVGMDAYVAGSGHPEYADMTCGADAMADELDRHAAAACASVDPTENAAAAAAHAEQMAEWAAHQRARAGDGMMGMGGGGMDGMGHPGGTFNCADAP